MNTSQNSGNLEGKITLEVIEEFVATHPDGTNTKGPWGSYTYFNKGADANGPFDDPNEVRPGCLFGHIIASLGGGPDDVTEGESISGPSNAYLLADRKQALTARQTQSVADSSHAPWLEAWKQALKVFPLS